MLELHIDHDHHDPALHTTAAGLELVGFVDAKELLGAEPARLSDIQFHENISVVTVNGRTDGSAGGFFVLDISTPSSPAVLSRYRSGSEDNWYTKIGPDGRFVFLTANGGASPRPALGGIQQAAGSGAAAMGARGIHIVDIVDPRQPNLAGYYPAPVRVINLAVHKTEQGAVYVFASMTYDRLSRVANVGAARDLNFVSVLRFDPMLVRLEEVARWQPTDAANVVDAFPHDLSVAVHPLNGRTLLYAAYWDAGAYIVDVSDPRQPRQVARIRPLGPGDHAHTFKPHPGLIDGRYFAVVSPETFAGESPGFYRLVDITDARQPAMAGQWQVPQGIEANPENLLFSPHEFTLRDGRLYASQFHAGAWVLTLPDLAPVGAWQTSVGDPSRTADWAVDICTSVTYGGHVWAVDMGSGIVILRETHGDGPVP